MACDVGGKGRGISYSVRVREVLERRLSCLHKTKAYILWSVPYSSAAAHCTDGRGQGVAELTPRPFALEEETGTHHGHAHVHRTRMPICMHNWGPSASVVPSAVIYHRHRRPHALEELVVRPPVSCLCSVMLPKGASI